MIINDKRDTAAEGEGTIVAPNAFDGKLAPPKNIRLLQLITGEQIIGQVNDLSAFVEITEPVRLVPIPPRNQNEQTQVAFVPWQPFTKDKTFKIGLDHIMANMTPLDEFEMQYRSLVAGIIMAKKPSIIH